MLLIPPAYFAPISVFSYLVKNDGGSIIIDDEAPFRKQTVRNRCDILGANGKIRLTVPLKKWSTHVPVGNIQIDNDNSWMRNHGMSIRSAYGNAPFYLHYEAELQGFYANLSQSLLELDISSFKMINNWLGIENKIVLKSEIKKDECINAQWIDLTELFSKKRQGLTRIPRYQQVFSDRFEFQKDLSILDLVFNLGPRSVQYLYNLGETSTH